MKNIITILFLFVGCLASGQTFPDTGAKKITVQQLIDNPVLLNTLGDGVIDIDTITI